MLACVCERRFGAGDGDAGRRRHRRRRRVARGAKVKRRCPHVFGPLPGPAATRGRGSGGKKAKASEKAAVAAGAALPPAPPTRRGYAYQLARLFSVFADEPEALVASAAAGACFGVVLGAVLWRRHG